MPGEECFTLLMHVAQTGAYPPFYGGSGQDADPGGSLERAYSTRQAAGLYQDCSNSPTPVSRERPASSPATFGPM